MKKNWSNISAATLGSEIAKGRINPVELTEYFLAKIEAHALGRQIYARTAPGRARGEAAGAAARAKAGQRRGPLDGVPISWKDNFDSGGLATEAGSALLRHRTPSADAAVLATATREGLVCLGKTHMSELAFSGLGLNPITATPPCVNNPLAVAGGSSSGAAASVAQGLAPAAMGSDTGGSIRVPAAWNDLVGFKPAHGAVPMAGVVPLCRAFDVAGPLARNVNDCALIYAAIQGARPLDLAETTLSGARLLVIEGLALEGLRAQPAAGFEDALSRLAKAGAQITHAPAPEVAKAMDAAGSLFTPEAYATWRDIIESAPEKMFPPILARFRAGGAVSAADYLAAWETLHGLRAIFRSNTAGYDAVLMPTSPILPPLAQRLLDDPAYFAAENLLALRNTRIANVMDCAAITLPTAQPSCGISLLAPPGHEGRLLRLASAAEAALR